MYTTRKQVSGDVDFNSASVLESGGDPSRGGQNEQTGPATSQSSPKIAHAGPESGDGAEDDILGFEMSAFSHEGTKQISDKREAGQISPSTNTSATITSPALQASRIDDVTTSNEIGSPSNQAHPVQSVLLSACEVPCDQHEDIELTDMRPRQDSTGDPIVQQLPEVAQDAPGPVESYMSEIIHRVGTGGTIWRHTRGRRKI